MKTERDRSTKQQRIRATLMRREPLCRHCLVRGVIRAATELDHIVPLSRGGSDDDDNKQPLCTECHYRKTVTERGARPHFGCDANGMPLDPDHPWSAKGGRGSKGLQRSGQRAHAHHNRAKRPLFEVTS